MSEYVVKVHEKRKMTDFSNDPLTYLLSLPVLEEIVRCRDCRHCDPEVVKFSDGESGSDCTVVAFCNLLRRETCLQNFCSWGERCD